MARRAAVHTFRYWRPAIPDTQRALMVNLTAVDANGDADPTFNDPVRVYAQFLGTLTPNRSST